MESLVGKYGAVCFALPLDKEDADWVNGVNQGIGHQGIIGRVIEDDGNIITFYCPSRTMKFLKKDFTVYETPYVTWGDHVFITAKNTEATIYALAWHYKRKEYMYLLQLPSGKKLTKRYFKGEFEKI